MAAAGNNIASHLPLMAARQPETLALHIPVGKSGRYQSITFQQLEDESNRIACTLELYGIHRGMRVALMVPPGLEFFALTFALFKLAAVPVLIDPGIGVKNLKTCLNEAEPTAFIGIPKAHVARILFGWGKTTIKLLITVGAKKFWRGASLKRLVSAVPGGKAYRAVRTTEDETAAILFTSGSTGVPKGVVYSHGNFMAQVEQLKAIYQIAPGEIDLPTFPLFALFAPALGMSAVIPVMDFTRPGSVDPENIIEPIKRFKVTTMFGSPALINRVGRYGADRGIQLPTLKRAISAGAPVPAAILERFTRMLGEDVQVYTPYGATEALPVCSIGSHEIVTETRHLTDQGQGVCVGFPVPDIDLRIIGISDDVILEWDDSLLLEDGSVGEIVVKGPQVTLSYYNRPESTRLAKINCTDGGVFHRMGDLGYRDSSGRVWFCGRKSHRVICPEETYYTIPCEAVFNTHDDVFRSALVGIKKSGQMIPVICIELEAAAKKKDLSKIKKELEELALTNGKTGRISEILFHPNFPVDIRHNAKIFREKLADWAAGQIS